MNKIVGVIATLAELSAATRLRKPPDLFELRLDLLPEISPALTRKLGAPLLVTVRPADGETSLALAKRYQRFLPDASAIDIELRSIRALLPMWRNQPKLLRIASHHDFHRTPTFSQLEKWAAEARKLGADIFKIVARAERREDFELLRHFLLRYRPRVCVMATGKFGRASRVEFPALGSRLVYAPILQSFHEGQLTLAQLRRALRSRYLRR